MKVYFSDTRIIELEQYYQIIAPLFKTQEQNAMASFLNDIKRSGYCDMELYNNIYSILNNVSSRNKVEKNLRKKESRKIKTQNECKDDEADVIKCIQTIELIRLQFATRYYVLPSRVENVNENNNQLKRDYGDIV